MSQRLKEITYLRAFAALSIVLIHATSGYIKTLPLGAALNQFPRYGSAVFIIMSGFILYHIELKRPSPSYMHFFRHRFLKVSVPYVIWTFLYTLFDKRSLIFGADGFQPVLLLKEFLYGVVTGTTSVHLYFILIMIQLYALFPLLKKWIERRPAAMLTGAAVISFVFQGLIYLHRVSLITLPSIKIPYVALFPGWFIFFCFGIFLRIRLKETMAFWQRRKGLCAALWTALLALSIWEIYVSPVNITLRPSISLYGIMSFFLFYMIFDNLKNKTAPTMDRLLEWTANNSFHIYLVHPLVLSTLGMITSWGGYLGMVSLYICTVLGTCLAVHILNESKRKIRELREPFSHTKSHEEKKRSAA